MNIKIMKNAGYTTEECANAMETLSKAIIDDDKMKEDYSGDLYDVYYKDNNEETQCVCYFAHSQHEAERLFKSEQCVGEEIIKIVKCK